MSDDNGAYLVTVAYMGTLTCDINTVVTG